MNSLSKKTVSTLKIRTSDKMAVRINISDDVRKAMVKLLQYEPTNFIFTHVCLFVFSQELTAVLPESEVVSCNRSSHSNQFSKTIQEGSMLCRLVYLPLLEPLRQSVPAELRSACRLLNEVLLIRCDNKANGAELQLRRMECRSRSHSCLKNTVVEYAAKIGRIMFAR